MNMPMLEPVRTGTHGTAPANGTASPRSTMPGSREGERPTVYADRVGEWYVERRSANQRKAYGLFLTPQPVAGFMGRQISVRGRKLRVLDPAAGAGVLACAAVEALVTRKSKPDAIELVAYEVDNDLIAPLRAVLDHLTRWCRDQRGTTIHVHVRGSDFILANADAMPQVGLLRPCTPAGSFDAVIANPPYFKIGKCDPRAAAVPDVVHGQPNIYALFMAVCAAILRPGGDFVFITPRSFASGHYFRRFRSVFFDMIRPTLAHVFDSRRDAFRRAGVLQENIILCGVREDCWHENPARTGIEISSSLGVPDIDRASRRKLPASAALNTASVDRILCLPVSDADDEALSLVGSWPAGLRDMGLDISTGPVIPFRATGLVVREGRVPGRHAPLLWMNHVHAMRATWPLDRHKPEYIQREGARALLVPNRNYVLLRRFSAKEEVRRLTAAPWIATDIVGADVGLENHLNYIHRPGGELSEDEAWGLAALYNSRLLDTWFRAVNGSTQVNATELRAMPLSAHGTITELGRRVKRLADPLNGLDTLVAGTIAPQAMGATANG